MSIKAVATSLLLLFLPVFSILPVAQVNGVPSSYFIEEEYRLTTEEGAECMPRAFRDASGTIWLVYFSNPYVTSIVWSPGWSIQYLKSDNEGETWSGPHTIYTFEGTADGVSMTKDSRGRIWVVWSTPKSPTGGNNEVWYSISNDGGNTWTSPATPYMPPAPWNGYIHPSIIEAFGKIWIFFRHWMGGNREGILYFSSDDGGLTWSSRTVIVDGPESEDQPYPYLDSFGKLWLVWSRDYSWAGPRDIWYISTGDGITWSAETQITNSPDISESHPSIVEDTSGNMFVFFERYEGDQFDVWYCESDSRGNEWTDPIRITEDPGEDRFPTGALAGSNIYVFWESNRAGSSDIWYTKMETLVSYPYPKIISVDCPKEIDLSDWITFTVKARNDGEKADEMYISVSLPDNLLTENIQIVSHDLQDAYILPVGSEVWGDYGTAHPLALQYPLVEGFKENWEKGETRTMQFRVKPLNRGTFRFYVKTTALKAGEWSYDPQSGIIDQQNEYTYVYAVSVNRVFVPTIDGYRFPNWDLLEEWAIMKAEMQRHLEFSSEELSLLCPVLDLLYVTAQRLGHCYGMASTSILYFNGEINKPAGYEDIIVNNWAKDGAVVSKIEDYNVKQLEHMLEQLRRDLVRAVNQDAYSVSEEFEKISNSIQEGRPIMLLLSSPEGFRHAVAAIGIEEKSANQYSISLYDNNYPNETCEASITGNNFVYEDYRNVFAVAPTAYWGDSTYYRSLIWKTFGVLKEYLEVYGKILVTLDCPANMTITDQFGRELGYIEGIFVNEIPEAEIETGIGVQVCFLPSDLIYNITIMGTGSGKFNCSIMTADHTVTYKDVPVTSETVCTLKFPEKKDLTMKMDLNGDGTFEKTLNPIFKAPQQIDEINVSDSRVDLGSVQTIGFHAQWNHNSSDVVEGSIRINGTEYTTNDSGWTILNVSSPNIGEMSWIVTEVDGIGIDLYNETKKATIIWDQVDITLSIANSRISTETKADILIRARYRYDGEEFSGSVLLNDTILTQSNVGKRGYKTDSILDSMYGLTKFTTNEIYCIFDGIDIRPSFEASTPRVIYIDFVVSFEYDGSPIGDAIVEVNNIVAQSLGNGRYKVTLSSWLPFLSLNVRAEKEGFEPTAYTIVIYPSGNILMTTIPVVVLCVTALSLNSRKNRRKKKGKVEEQLERLESLFRRGKIEKEVYEKLKQELEECERNKKLT